jgi:ribonucleotide reductase beta subunit family protein with ferritin-like domain
MFFISRDEAMHADFAILINNHIVNKPSKEKLEKLSARNAQRQFPFSVTV